MKGHSGDIVFLKKKSKNNRKPTTSIFNKRKSVKEPQLCSHFMSLQSLKTMNAERKWKEGRWGRERNEESRIKNEVISNLHTVLQ